MTRTSPHADSHATSPRIVDPWQHRAACRDRPEEWDLDVIGGDPLAVRAAQQACFTCPALAQCETFTLALPKKDRPQELVQAGRVWTTSRHLPRRIQRDEAEEVDVDKLRDSHAQYVRRVSVGLGVTPDLEAEERAFQRWRKREQRKAVGT